MAFNVDFYKFSKRENATYRPSGTATTYSCVLKEASSIANPTIQLNVGTAADPDFNYAYIAEFNRYYYVSDWTWVNNRLWEASLVTDILATYKDQIGAATLYVLRSSAAYDGSIVDNYYPVKAEATSVVKHLNLPWTTFVNGCVVIGVVSDSAQLGSIAYYAMELSELSDLVSALLDDSLLEDHGFDITDATIPLQKSLIDPLSYIKSAVYLPISYDQLSGTTGTVHIWNWDLDTVQGKRLGMAAADIFTELDIALDKHPLTLTRGNYLNIYPYTKAVFQFIPFNSIEIDTTITASNPNLKIRYFINPFDGTGTLQLFCGTNVLGTQSAQVGVPIQLSQVTKDYFGAQVGAINAVGGVLGNVMTGNIAGAITSAASGIGNGIQALTPKVSSVGSNGSFSHLHYTPSLYQEFYTPVDEDNAHCGRPLCQNRQINTIPGYIMVKDGEVDIPGFDGESDAVKSYLESGFFYG